MLKQLGELPPPMRRRIQLSAALLVAIALLVVAWQLLLVLIPLAVSAIIASLLIPVMRLGNGRPWHGAGQDSTGSWWRELPRCWESS